MEILKLKQPDGTWQDVVALVGPKGDTPVKGTDYYTEADKQEMVQLVLATLPSSEEVSY